MFFILGLTLSSYRANKAETAARLYGVSNRAVSHPPFSGTWVYVTWWASLDDKKDPRDIFFEQHMWAAWQYLAIIHQCKPAKRSQSNLLHSPVSFFSEETTHFHGWPSWVLWIWKAHERVWTCWLSLSSPFSSCSWHLATQAQWLCRSVSRPEIK